jgi:hypothetical protein
MEVLYNKDLHNLYSLSSMWVIKLRRIRLLEHMAGMQEMRSAYRLPVGRKEGERLLGRHRCILEGNTDTY